MVRKKIVETTYFFLNEWFRFVNSTAVFFADRAIFTVSITIASK